MDEDWRKERVVLSRQLQHKERNVVVVAAVLVWQEFHRLYVNWCYCGCLAGVSQTLCQLLLLLLSVRSFTDSMGLLLLLLSLSDRSFTDSMHCCCCCLTEVSLTQCTVAVVWQEFHRLDALVLLSDRSFNDCTVVVVVVVWQEFHWLHALVVSLKTLDD